jgi:hypothetical protein
MPGCGAARSRATNGLAATAVQTNTGPILISTLPLPLTGERNGPRQSVRPGLIHEASAANAIRAGVRVVIRRTPPGVRERALAGWYKPRRALMTASLKDQHPLIRVPNSTRGAVLPVRRFADQDADQFC